ncbi:MAG: DbpA RNA binding domain-containing protein [Gemmatimonadales bacterium]|nr:DbpA RNA binding domain-containing protein [Gemmatimonadales bacterium]
MTIEAQVKVERSRHTVLVMPPDVSRVADWDMLFPGLAPGVSKALVVCADHEQASLWADAAPPELRAHAVTGLTRTAALLKERRVGVLAGAPADLAALVARAALKLDTIETIVLAWPEGFADALDPLLAEAPDARRIVLSWNPPALTDFLERHARRAEIVGALPLDPDGRPLGPVGSARYAVVSASRREAAVRDVLDTLRSARPFVWDGGEILPDGKHDLVIATTLPTRHELTSLIAVAPAPVLIATASQLSYLRSIAALTPLPLSPGAERAEDRAAALRAEISARLERGDVDAELLVLGPLFERWDPVEIAGALLAMRREQGAGSGEQGEPPPAPATGWLKVFVTIGRKDRAAPKDLVGALIREVGLDKGQIGRIDMKDSFSLIDVAAGVAEQTARRLSGVTIRGKRASARLDRAG